MKALRENLVNAALVVLMTLMTVTAILTFVNQSVLEHNYSVRQQVETVKKEFLYHLDQTLRHMDVGLRGYAIIQDPKYLYIKPQQLRRDYDQNQLRLDSLLQAQGYDDTQGLEDLRSLRRFMADYFGYFNGMVDDLQKGDLEHFKQAFQADKGSQHGVVFTKAKQSLYNFEDAIFAQADARYLASVTRSTYLQIIMLLIGLPTIWMVIRKLKEETHQKKRLLTELADNNQKYLFHSGKHAETHDPRQIIESSIRSLRDATDFVTRISEGDYQSQWTEMNQDNQRLNTQNLAGKLTGLRDTLKQAKLEASKRNWANEGLAAFSEMVSNHQNTLQALSSETVRFLTKYLGAQQGSLFLPEEEKEGAPFLELIACYAFDRKKFLEKRIGLGNGLVGQTYLEGTAIILTEIPQGYPRITSGLGEATPACLVIVPFKHQAKTEAIIELASFHRMEPHQLEFLEKAGELVASAIRSGKATGKMSALLEQSQQQAEEMRAQEEELRQNQEELQATQEEISRKYQALFRQITELNYQSKFEQLRSITSTKKRNIEYYFDIIRNQIRTLAENRMVREAVRDFKSAFYGIGQGVSREQLLPRSENLRKYYVEEFIPRLNDQAEQRTSVEIYLPDEARPTILQHLYISGNEHPTGKKALLEDAGDGSDYSKAHAAYHATMRSYLEKFGYYDIFLLDAQTGDLMYSVFKEVDFATSLLSGPYHDSNFGTLVKQAIASDDRDFVKLIDFAPYDPSYRAPASFIACPVYDNDEKTGILVFQMPIHKINQILTGDNRWQMDGLGESGETVVVGSDYKLRSISRGLIENEDAYLLALKNAGYEDSLLQQIQQSHTSILLEERRQESVSQALNGQSGTRMEVSVSGDKLLQAYAPLEVEDVRWMILSTLKDKEASQWINDLQGHHA